MAILKMMLVTMVCGEQKAGPEWAVIAAYLIDRILDATASVCAQLAHTPP
jgi:hypothetical protein